MIRIYKCGIKISFFYIYDILTTLHTDSASFDKQLLLPLYSMVLKNDAY